MSTWKLARTNAIDSRELTGWGITGAQLQKINSGVDNLELKFGLVDLLGNLPFDPQETLVILRDDVPYFRGLVSGQRRGAFGSSEGLTVTLDGPWWYLTKITYQQSRTYVIDYTTDPFTNATVYTSKIISGLDADGNRINVHDQIVEILEYAIAKGAPIGIGTIDSALAGPRQIFTDTNCAELIIKLLKWNPGHSIYWDYSTNPPRINIRARGNRAALILDIADGRIAQVVLNPNYELQLRGVTVQYHRVHQRAGFSFETIQIERAGPDPEGINALVLTLGVNGSYIVDSDNIPEEGAPLGIASAIYNEYSIAPYEGDVTVIQPEAGMLNWLSKILSVANGVADWATAQMVVQQSVEDLFPLENVDGEAYRVELIIGPPRQLYPTDLSGLRVGGPSTDLPPSPVIHPPGGQPPDPPEPPHTDYGPLLFAVSNKKHSGTEHIDGPEQPFPSPEEPPPIPANPPYPTIEDDISTIGAGLDKAGRRQGNSGATAWRAISDASGYFTETVFDFRTLSIHAIGIKLLGTETKSKADGTSESKAVEKDLGAGIGGTLSFTAEAPFGAIHYYDDSIYFAVSQGSGEVVYDTLRVYTAF